VVTVTLWVAVVYLKGEALQLDMTNVKINMLMIPDSGFEAMLFFVPPCGIECQLHNTVGMVIAARWRRMTACLRGTSIWPYQAMSATCSQGCKVRCNSSNQKVSVCSVPQVQGVGRADVLLYFKCPTTKQMRCPVNAYYEGVDVTQ